jgi:hypothetical protein
MRRKMDPPAAGGAAGECLRMFNGSNRTEIRANVRAFFPQEARPRGVGLENPHVGRPTTFDKMLWWIMRCEEIRVTHDKRVTEPSETGRSSVRVSVRTKAKAQDLRPRPAHFEQTAHCLRGAGQTGEVRGSSLATRLVEEKAGSEDRRLEKTAHVEFAQTFTLKSPDTGQLSRVAGVIPLVPPIDPAAAAERGPTCFAKKAAERSDLRF